MTQTFSHEQMGIRTDKQTLGKHWYRQMDNQPVYNEMNENIGFRKKILFRCVRRPDLSGGPLNKHNSFFL